jgi:porphobilinogen deaminase
VAAVNPVIVQISTSGDVSSSEGTTIQQVSMDLQSSRTVDFTGTLDDALINKQIDSMAVHSLKDIPPEHHWKNHELFQIDCPKYLERIHPMYW